MTEDPARPEAPLPALRPIDRTALERVLRRAGELQEHAADPDEEMSEEQLVALGTEVGLSPQFLRQALAEERTRVTLREDTSSAGRWAGPAVVAARRLVRGKPTDVLAALDRWMQREECLKVKRHFGERIVWEPRRDFLGEIKRGFNVGGRGYHLTRAREVGATAVVVDAGTVLVSLDADLSSARAARLKSGSAVAVTGAATGAAIVGFGALFAATVLPFAAIAVLPLAAGAGGGISIVRRHRATAERVQLALEQALDAFEHMPSPGGGAASLIAALLPRLKG